MGQRPRQRLQAPVVSLARELQTFLPPNSPSGGTIPGYVLFLCVTASIAANITCLSTLLKTTTGIEECNEKREKKLHILVGYEIKKSVLQPSVVIVKKLKADFWNNYSKTVRGTDEQTVQKIDVIGLLTGLVAIGILLVITGILIYYLCQKKCKPRTLPGYGSNRRSNSSILRRQEEFSLHPLSLHTEQTGLPTYEQAVAQGDSYSPPPPYPGPSGMFKVFKKSLSLPGP
ncbi:hypothetical protein lerEdw1_014077 [Lerista edwardsae]|nr:hypothetical protein lerEdw1_014078 [Lerista edwardsae]KAJ6634325.1 hypothetical protein lerEdw1_014077 [Lerista edwardsae]